MRIREVFLDDLRPFRKQLLRFPETKPDSQLAEVHLLTGENGSGKTRFLAAIEAAFGETGDLERRTRNLDSPRFAVYVKSKRFSGFYEHQFSTAVAIPSESLIIKSGNPLVAFRRYWQPVDFKSATLRLMDDHEGLIFNGLNEMANVDYFTCQAYKGSSRLADQQVVPFSSFEKNDRTRTMSLDNPSPITNLQEIANIKTRAAHENLNFGTGPNLNILERLEGVIGDLTGKTFRLVLQEGPLDFAKTGDWRLCVLWGDRHLLINHLPDGLRSILSWLVSCIAAHQSLYPEVPIDEVPLVLLLDEPECHLHPKWQRLLIPAAQRMFPNAQFIIATHSPFIISSVNSGWIHILRGAEDSGEVTWEKPIKCSSGDSYIDAVEDVLGLSKWYDPESESLLDEFRQLKKKVIAGHSTLEDISLLADEISKRGEGLAGIVSREMHQLQRLVKNK